MNRVWVTVLWAAGGVGVASALVERPLEPGQPAAEAGGGDVPLTVRASAAWGAAAAGSGEPVWVVVEIDGTGAPSTRPLDLTLVVDTSGSMDGAGITRAREAVAALARTLGPDDRVTVQAFSDDVHTLAHGASSSEVGAVAGRLDPHGGTHLSAALAGLSSLSSDEAHLGRAVLMSDGRPTVGVTDTDALVALAAAAGRPVTALGMGTAFDEVLLERVAEAGGGRYRFAMGPDLSGLLEDEVAAMRSVVAQGVEVEIRPAEGARLHRVASYDDASEAPGFTARVGDLSSRGRRKVAFQVVLGDGEEVATVGVHARRPDGTPWDAELAVRVSRGDPAGTEVGWAQEEVGRVLVGLARLDARAALASGRAGEAGDRFSEAARELRGAGYPPRYAESLEALAAEARQTVGPIAREDDLRDQLEALGYLE